MADPDRRIVSTRPLAEVEKETILVAIINEGGIRQAARKLGISFQTVYNKLAAYGLGSKPTSSQILQEINRVRSASYQS